MALISCNECGIWTKDGAGSEFTFAHNMQIASFSFFIAYGYVYTRLKEPECSTQETALLDLSDCGVTKEYLVQMAHSNCKMC